MKTIMRLPLWLLMASLTVALTSCDVTLTQEGDLPEAPSAHAGDAGEVFEFHIATDDFICNFGAEFCPAITIASKNGDRLVITNGEGWFDTSDGSAWGGGEFRHTNADGSVVFGEGTWEATSLLTFHDWGNSPLLPEILHAGSAKLNVRLDEPNVGASFNGQLDILCQLPGMGPHEDTKLPGGFVEGITLVVPGALNFNKVEQGGTIFCPEDCGDFGDLF